MERLIPGHLKGTIYSFTTERQAPSTHEEFAPYVVALIDVEQLDGSTQRMTMRMTDLDFNRMDPRGVESQVHIGDRVEVVTRRLRSDGERGLLDHGYAARRCLEWGNDDEYPIKIILASIWRKLFWLTSKTEKLA